MTAVISRGLDKSHFQGEGELWASLKSRFHLAWGACKATEGTSFVDGTFAWNWAGLKAAGLTRIAYHYAHPELSATAQADHFLSVVKPTVGDVLCLDLERGTTMGATNRWAKTWLTRVRQKAPGCALLIYMGTGYASTATGAGMSQYADGWWVARYPGLRAWPTVFNPTLAGNTTGFPAPVIWQWTDSFAGKYDANVSTLSAVQIATPKGADNMAMTPADAMMFFNTPLPNPRDPSKSATFATWIRYNELRTEDNGHAIAAQAVEIAALKAQIDAIPAAVQKAVNDAITAGLVTVQINAKETT